MILSSQESNISKDLLLSLSRAAFSKISYEPQNFFNKDNFFVKPNFGNQEITWSAITCLDLPQMCQNNAHCNEF